jgi:hypothetical protein
MVGGMSKEDRRRASTNARIELRKQALRLRESGRTLSEISEITGYAVPYLSTLLRALARAPEQAVEVARGGRLKASGRALTLVQEEQVQDWVCKRCPDHSPHAIQPPPSSPWPKTRTVAAVRIRRDATRRTAPTPASARRHAGSRAQSCPDIRAAPPVPERARARRTRRRLLLRPRPLASRIVTSGNASANRPGIELTKYKTYRSQA